MPFYASLGSISSGTLRTEDLIPCFMDELDSLKSAEFLSDFPNPDHFADVDNLLAEIEQHRSRLGDDYYASEEADYDLDGLFKALDPYAPPYCYFGSHESDGADYGFWVSPDELESAQHDGTLLAVDDLSEVPDDYTGEVLYVNERGNTSLYLAERGELTEVWAV